MTRGKWGNGMTDAQKRIERSFQRAMDLRDSMPSDLAEAEETEYATAYLEHYRRSDAEGFKAYTRQYLRALRSLSTAYHALETLFSEDEDQAYDLWAGK